MTPRPPSTDRDAIVDAALALLREGGLDRLSLRRLGARLGVDPMTVHHHMGGIDGVLDAVVERVWQEASAAASHTAIQESPDLERLAPVLVLCRALRATLLAHPAAVPLVATRPVLIPAQMALVEEMLDRLTTREVGAAEAMRLLDCAVAYVVGKVAGELRTPAGSEGEPASVDEDLARLDAARRPHLAAALAGGYGWDPDGEFEQGLAALLRGWRPTTSAR